jgi:hypothetical protein
MHGESHQQAHDVQVWLNMICVGKHELLCMGNHINKHQAENCYVAAVSMMEAIDLL